MKLTPKEKAEEIVNELLPHITGVDRYNITLGIYDKEIAKQCALICVNEIIKANPHTAANPMFDSVTDVVYWLNVKQEIKSL